MAGKSPKKPPAARLNDALYPPRFEDLDDLEGAGLATREAEGPAYERILESICGVADDSQAVEQYDGSLGVTTQFVLDRQAPVAQVQWNTDLASRYANPGNVNGARFGTGAMISADLFLTCAHLFDGDGGGWVVPRQPGTSVAINPAEIATNMHLNFNYQVDPAGAMRTVEEFAITQLVEFRLGGLDMAVCRVAGNPGSRFGFLQVDTVDAVIGDMLAIVGHPAGVPKRVEAGPLTGVSGNYLTYNDIDTLGGNSGSPILSARTGRIVGVHTNGGCTPSSPAGGGANSGVAIGRIRAVSPTLQSLPASIGPIATALARDLGVGTPRALDLRTNLALDNIATTLARDLGTLHWRDNLSTGWRDLINTGWRDQVNTGWRDQVNTTFGENVVDPGGFDPVVNPVVNPGARPFVQAGAFQQIDPMQGGAGEATGDEAVELLTGALAELEAAILVQQQTLAALEGVWNDLRTLLEGEAG
jgi:V8-like Glu-specific endopeptidase